MLFGVPAHKDAEGSEAWNPDGITQQAIRALRDEFGNDAVIVTDLCLDEYTDHGHCGVLTDDGEVDNDAHARALRADRRGAGRGRRRHGRRRSGMMDGQVGAIRDALDDAGPHRHRRSWPTRRSSRPRFYGPFREAAECAPQFGDRRGYQHGPGQRREALREIRTDLDEGADIVMVKPALPYLDVVRAAADTRASRWPRTT